MDDSPPLTSLTEADHDRATVLYARTYAQAYATDPSNATASRAALRAVLEAFAPRPEDAPQHELIRAGVDLAQYASYSEIVGQIGVNRAEIRECCDRVFQLNAPYRRLVEAARFRDDDAAETRSAEQN